MINFSSEDRAESVDGKTFTNYRWTTSLGNYKNFGGRTLVSYGEAIWHKPEGEYRYAKFDLVDIEYNTKKYIGLDEISIPKWTKTSN